MRFEIIERSLFEIIRTDLPECPMFRRTENGEWDRFDGAWTACEPYERGQMETRYQYHLQVWRAALCQEQICGKRDGRVRLVALVSEDAPPSQ